MGSTENVAMPSAPVVGSHWHRSLGWCMNRNVFGLIINLMSMLSLRCRDVPGEAQEKGRSPWGQGRRGREGQRERESGRTPEQRTSHLNFPVSIPELSMAQVESLAGIPP